MVVAFASHPVYPNIVGQYISFNEFRIVSAINHRMSLVVECFAVSVLIAQQIMLKL